MNLSIAEAVSEGALRLRAAGIPDSRRESATLLAYAIGRDRTYVITHNNDSLVERQVESFRAFISRRVAHEPVQYITGHQEFFGLDFEVTPDVLIPRPETELIVEAALELLKDVKAPTFADIGTGSGCIAISLLHELTHARAIATDISAAALQIAQRNAERHGIADRLTLVESDCLDAVNQSESFDLVASNPPYVADNELATLQPEVRDYEPRAALFCGPDGLGIIRRLLIEAPRRLRPRRHLVFEIGLGQLEAVELLVDPRTWTLREIRNDLQGIARTVVMEKR
jgi:release factor glutamine methyltransferase